MDMVRVAARKKIRGLAVLIGVSLSASISATSDRCASNRVVSAQAAHIFDSQEKREVVSQEEVAQKLEDKKTISQKVGGKIRALKNRIWGAGRFSDHYIRRFFALATCVASYVAAVYVTKETELPDEDEDPAWALHRLKLNEDVVRQMNADEILIHYARDLSTARDRDSGELYPLFRVVDWLDQGAMPTNQIIDENTGLPTTALEIARQLGRKDLIELLEQHVHVDERVLRLRPELAPLQQQIQKQSNQFDWRFGLTREQREAQEERLKAQREQDQSKKWSEFEAGFGVGEDSDSDFFADK